MDFKYFNDRILETYTRAPLEIVRAEGSLVRDSEGREYLDMFPGFGAGNTGHRHPRVLEAVSAQMEKVIHVPNVYYSGIQAELAEKIISTSFPGHVFLCNSGTEANEAAIKFARKYSRGKQQIVTLTGSFHGRTMGSLAATGQSTLREGFDPILQGFVHCNPDDIETLRTLVGEHTAAIMLEPVQGEGGVRPLSPEFLKEARSLCDRYGSLLILDEVQTGMGRCGSMYAWQRYGVQPDLMCLAKSLGGGLPIGALVVSDSLENALTPGSHGSTFGGNALACAAGLGVYRAMEEENLPQRALTVGDRLAAELRRIVDGNDSVLEVRNLGMMIGVEFREPCTDLVSLFREKGVLVNCTHKTVLRIMPALNISDEQIETFTKVFSEIIAGASV